MNYYYVGIMHRIAQRLLLVFMGYIFVFGSSGQAVLGAVGDPMNADWGSIAGLMVEDALVLRDDLQVVVEGPVKDFIVGLKSSIIENSDEFEVGESLIANNAGSLAK